MITYSLYLLILSLNQHHLIRLKELANLLEALDPEAKEIVTFHYLLGYSYAEIGEMKQMTETAIKVAAHRAVKKLSANI